MSKEDVLQCYHQILRAAGIPGRVRTITNQYWPEHPDYDDIRKKHPWVDVYTECGVIRMGWRKRVISIDWSNGMFGAYGWDVVGDKTITHGENYTHAWGYEAAEACLKRLWEKR